jgi:hypothetical protein
MIIEIPRDEFLEKIQVINLPAGEWLAVCLVITQSLRKLNILDSEMEKVIELGKHTFSGFQKGFFARIGWTTYIACINGEKENAILIINKNLNEITQKNKHCHLWRYNTANIEGIPSDKIWELEWKTNKNIKV